MTRPEVHSGQIDYRAEMNDQVRRFNGAAVKDRIAAGILFLGSAVLTGLDIYIGLKTGAQGNSAIAIGAIATGDVGCFTGGFMALSQANENAQTAAAMTNALTTDNLAVQRSIDRQRSLIQTMQDTGRP